MDQPEENVVEIPKAAKMNALAIIWNLFKHKSERVKAQLRENGHSDEIVDELMGKYAKYAEKKK